MFRTKRFEDNPIVGPDTKTNWRDISSCNGCVVRDGDITHLLYRAIGKPDLLEAPNLTRSSIGYATSKEGVVFYGHKQLITPTESWEKYGCEDPRVTKIGDTFYIFYTALGALPFGPSSIKVALAISKDLKEIKEKHLVTPFNAKAMVLFPEKIGGKFFAVLTANTDMPPAKVALASFSEIEDIYSSDYWSDWYKNIDTHSLALRRSDKDHVEVGAPPVKTKDGWLLVYSHIQNYFSNDKVFGIEAVLLDLEDPSIILGRTHGPLIVPETTYEKYGYISNVVFPTGALIENEKTLRVYYGAADTTCAFFDVNLENLLSAMKPPTRMKHVHRNPHNPVLEPLSKSPWEVQAVFNPAAIDMKGSVHILYRAMSNDNTSTIGYARSDNGRDIDYRHPEPIYVPRADFESKKKPPTGFSGCEDPRITLIEGNIYMCYTAYDGVNPPRVAVSSITQENFLSQNWEWSSPELITPAGIDDKDACIFPEKVTNNKFMVMHRISHHVCADIVDSLDFATNKVDSCIDIMGPRSGMWDGEKVGISSPPMKTDHGWLLLYHGVSHENIYRVGAALFDKDDPTKLLARTSEAIFEPEEEYEKKGIVPNVVFPCGSVIRGDDVHIYYGGADTVLGIATISLSRILNMLS